MFGDLPSDANWRRHDCHNGITSSGMIPVFGFGVPGRGVIPSCVICVN